MITIETNGARVLFNPEGGHLDLVEFVVDGVTLRPMHRAHWRTGEHNDGMPEAVDAEAGITLKSLAGDFFCAPFAENDTGDGPYHGWPANGMWDLVGQHEPEGGGVTARFLLRNRVLGAQLFKEITLRPGHPVVYQTHRFVGGEGAISAGHHPMVRVDGGARLSFSAKAFGATPATPLESDPARGRSALVYPQEFADLSAVKLASGGTVDLRSLPGPEASEDFLLLAEAPGHRLGWSAVLAPAGGFIYLGLRDPRVLPFTLLWLSNGGRDYAPFSGRHKSVLGVEEACSFFIDGYRASIAPNTLTARGYPTALTLVPDGERVVHFAFGAIPVPAGWGEVTNVSAGPDALTVTERGGETRQMPFRGDFLGAME
ncbi:hypothetical protein LGH83_08240 [Lichenihabitans sp. PAMC28606]|uniref:hypothetical protein n=1 Tax=Lichenihabitans sp. PAMC28606 TaxID=2880932 RepID=UPI001D0B1589|nr:hypothetical protein [Lichenihabitans sp. PAMC28606]UDL96157.1 hypothetical protein LGH83_08240 [Lichenihabitans sp. PAMC28606]